MAPHFGKFVAYFRANERNVGTARGGKWTHM
jgi:hypothetical protein